MTDNETPRVWIGCLACYNAGRLTGDWYPAITAGEVPSEDVHAEIADRLGYDRETIARTHEELWVMDHEHLPITGECSPADAQAWAEAMAELHESEVPAFCAYVRDVLGYGYAEPASAASEFQDVYMGEWSSFVEYAQDMAEDIGAVPEDASWPAYCIDWERAARDLMMDGYTTSDSPLGVYVFRPC